MYNLLIILFIIFIIILYINNTYEGFQAITNTLPTTMQIPEIPNKIITVNERPEGLTPTENGFHTNRPILNQNENEITKHNVEKQNSFV